MRVLEKKQNQIQNLQNKIRRLEDEEKNLSENRRFGEYQRNDFLSNRKCKSLTETTGSIPVKCSCNQSRK